MTYIYPDKPGHAPGDHDDLPDRIVWTPGRLSLVFTASLNRPVVLSGLGCAGEATITTATQPLVELIVTGDGRARTTTRFTNTGVGSRLRYLGHTTGSEQGEERLDIVQVDALTGLRVTTTFIASAAISAARVMTSALNDGEEPLVLEMISSFATGAVVCPDESTSDLVLYSGTGEQLAENRWSARPLWSHTALADFHSAFNSALHNQSGRGAVAAISTSTWSTARALPTAALENQRTGRSIAWQLEHNGGWRWEVDNVRDGEDSIAIVLLGPEDLDHHWSEELVPGASFTSVPISIAIAATGLVGAIGELTQHRRWLRRERRADRDSLLVFNDYMNTLNGDPTTERLLPLIDAAGRAGAECFCIDAGWYDDTDLGDWWPTVGEWNPSDRRFPGGGLARVVTAIRDAGMKVGLWLEPEVVGVRSPVAQSLPDAAFLQRHGRRVTEHDRFFLDLRQPDARAHLDATFDRLIRTFGVGFFKLDYNMIPGQERTFGRSLSAPACCHTIVRTSDGSPTYADATRASCSRTAAQAQCAPTSPCSSCSICSRHPTSRTSGSIRRSPREHRCRCCQSRQATGPTRSRG